MSDLSLSPFTPPIATSSLPGVGGAIGQDPEDFVVDEVPLYPFSGAGEHLLVRLRKRSWTTRDAVSAVARAAGVPVAEIGTAGMKDKHAVTTQWMSLPARRAAPPESWSLPEGMSVVEVTRHGNKLRTGHAKGNRFKIRLTGVEAVDASPTQAEERARSIVTALRQGGLPNFFGAQRFGHGGRNVAEAFDWLGAAGGGTAKAGGGKPGGRFERKLLSSVIQAEVFNRYLALRLEEGFGAPLTGEVVRLSTSSAVFVVEEPERELPRWNSHDIVPTGPIVGPKMRAASGRVLDLEESAASGVGLGTEMRHALGRFADGTRRDALVWLEDVLLTAEPPGALVLDFFLPAGSYATLLVRELTREPFIADSTRRAASNDD
jgi:tRNA pseudouridine13 synthase